MFFFSSVLFDVQKVSPEFILSGLLVALKMHRVFASEDLKGEISHNFTGTYLSCVWKFSDLVFLHLCLLFIHT